MDVFLWKKVYLLLILFIVGEKTSTHAVFKRICLWGFLQQILTNTYYKRESEFVYLFRFIAMKICCTMKVRSLDCKLGYFLSSEMFLWDNRHSSRRSRGQKLVLNKCMGIVLTTWHLLRVFKYNNNYVFCLSEYVY